MPMNDEPIDYQKEEALRYRMETQKEKTILFRNRLYTIFAAVALLAFVGLCVAAIWGIVKYTSREDEREKTIWQPLKEAVADFKESAANAKTITNNVAEGTKEIGPTIVAVRTEVEKLHTFTDTANTQLAGIGGSAQGWLQTFDTVLVGLREAEGELRSQIKLRGDDVGKTINATTDFIQHKDTEIKDLIGEGTKLLTTTNPKIIKLLQDFDVVIIGDEKDPENSMRGLVKKGNALVDQSTKLTVEATGIAHSGNLIGQDLQKRAHTILDPPPCKTFGCKMKVVLKRAQEFGGLAFVVERVIYGLP